MKRFIQHPAQTLLRIFLASSACFLTMNIEAKSGRQFKIPNGTVNSCSNCHVDPDGAGELTPFGESVFAAMGSIPRGATFNFWDADLAALNSDGDGLTNGEELGDPDGDFLNVGPSSEVTNPGISDRSENTAPNFTSPPNTNANVGEIYSYQTSAFDTEGDGLTFAKASGPIWLNVTAGGLVNGTPPEGASGSHSITLSVTDNGSPPMVGTQDYALIVSGSFVGFQNLNFDLPSEIGIAGPDQDPDNDKLPNIVEYALRLDPRQADNLKVPDTPQFDGENKMSFSLTVRDDDPNLAIQLETSTTIPSSSPVPVNAVVTDPNASDGYETWTFTDTVDRDSVDQRYGQFKFQLPQ